MVDTWNISFEIRLLFWNKIIRDKKSKHFVKNESFKGFTANRKHINWTKMFNILLVTILWTGGICLFSHLNRTCSKIIWSGLLIESPYIFSIRILILRWTCTLLQSIFCMTLPISSIESASIDKRFTVDNWQK